MYSEALKNSDPVDPHAFVMSYAQDRFGLSDSDAEAFWEVLNHPQTIIRYGKGDYGKGDAVASLRDQAVADRDLLYSMKVKSNKDEFERFLLMWDIRVQYLEYKVIEDLVNSPDFDRSKASAMLRQLKEKVISKTRGLDKRFTAACRGYLKPGDIERNNAVRSRQIVRLEKILENMAAGTPKS